MRQHEVTRIAARLAGANIRRGASVAIASANSINAALIMLGITSAGYMATPLNLVAGARVMQYVLSHCKAQRLYFRPSESLSLVEEALAWLCHWLRSFCPQQKQRLIGRRAWPKTASQNFERASPDDPADSIPCANRQS